MGFFAEKAAAQAPPVQQAAAKAVAPGAWWQDDIQMAPQRAESHAEPVSEHPGYYHPDTAAHLSAEDLCPACGSPNFAEYMPDYSMRGTVLGKIKKCFDYRYPATAVPAPDAGGSAANATLTRTTGRRGAGSWAGDATFNTAVRIL